MCRSLRLAIVISTGRMKGGLYSGGIVGDGGRDGLHSCESGRASQLLFLLSLVSWCLVLGLGVWLTPLQAGVCGVVAGPQYPDDRWQGQDRGSHLFNHCIMVSEIWAWCPVPRTWRWSAGWIGGQIGQDLDIGQDGGLRVNDLDNSVSCSFQLRLEYILPSFCVLLVVR